MWPLRRFAFCLLLFLHLHTIEGCSPKSCQTGIDAKKPACASDGFSYPNRCHLELHRCHNKTITFLYRGNCRPQHQQTCTNYTKANPTTPFTCRSDGNYSASQCHPKIGYCWCVTPQGFPVGNRLRYEAGMKPRCKSKKMIRSSKNRKVGKICKREDKALFNSNLIHIFTSDWVRENGKGGASDKQVLDWKFSQMDLDNNSQLDKGEYRDLKRLVKKVVKPKRCAKTFAKACDMNRDQVIGKQEWAECLTRDGMDDAKTGSEDVQAPEEADEADEDEAEDVLPSPYRPSSILTDRTFGNGQNFEDESNERRDEDPTDCLSDRKTAQDEGYQLYVPECTPDGRYAKVQCYKSAGYCWCVNEDTGKNIAGTAVKDQTPKCDQIASVSRPMKGCPEDKKISFLKDLMDYLHASMIKETNGTTITGIGGSSWRSSREEQVASWSFIFFDKNKNKVLDKVEWKTFKDTMASVKNLRRCGKKLPRYCDINKDRHISITEWLDCLNTNKFQEQLATTISPSSMKGRSPLDVLMDN